MSRPSRRSSLGGGEDIVTRSPKSPRSSRRRSVEPRSSRRRSLEPRKNKSSRRRSLEPKNKDITASPYVEDFEPWATFDVDDGDSKSQKKKKKKKKASKKEDDEDVSASTPTESIKKKKKKRRDSMVADVPKETINEEVFDEEAEEVEEVEQKSMKSSRTDRSGRTNRSGRSKSRKSAIRSTRESRKLAKAASSSDDDLSEAGKVRKAARARRKKAEEEFIQGIGIVNDLQAELKGEKQEKETLMAQLQEALDNNSKLLVEGNKIDKHLDELTQKLERAEEEKAKLQETVGTLERQENGDQEEIIQSLNLQIEDQKEEIKALEQQLQEAENEKEDAKIDELQLKINRLLEEKESVDQALKALEKENLQLKTSSNISSMEEEEVDSESIDIPDLAGSLTSLYDKIDKLFLENERLKEDVKRTAEEDLKDTSINEELNQNLIASKAEVTLLRTENAELEKAFNKLEKATEAKDDRMLKFEEVVEGQLDRIEFLEEKLIETEDEMFKMEDELKELLEGKSKHEDYIASAKAERGQRQEMLQVTRQSSRHLLSKEGANPVENEVARGPMSAFSEGIEGLRQELEKKDLLITELESEVKMLKKEREEMLANQKEEEKLREEDLKLIQEDIDEKFSALENHNSELLAKLEKAEKKASKAVDLEEKVKKLKEKLKSKSKSAENEEKKVASPGNHSEQLEREQKIIELEESLEAAKKELEFQKSDEYTERLKKELVAYQQGHKNLKMKIKSNREEAQAKLRRKEETIEFLQKEMIRMRKDVEFRLVQKKKMRNTVQKSMTDEIQNQIQDLEDEITHFKTSNIGLEEEIAKLKIEAREWKEKALENGYNEGKEGDDDDDDDGTTFSFRSRLSSIAKPYGDERSLGSRSNRLFFSPGESDQPRGAMGALGGLWNRMKVPPTGVPQNGAVAFTMDMDDD